MNATTNADNPETVAQTLFDAQALAGWGLTDDDVEIHNAVCMSVYLTGTGRRGKMTEKVPAVLKAFRVHGWEVSSIGFEEKRIVARRD